MDITDISKVASRKRMNADAEKLREKVSRETAKIIKLKVAQDTAYWDLKERLQQLAGAHERLQQNMLDVQMQHEAASAHYQRELRLRPDTLNKLHGTRDICDVLEDYGERLRRSVARCRADRAALGAAYAQCGARVRGLAADGARSRRLAAQHRDAARRAAERQRAEAQRLREALQQLGGARARAEHAAAARRELEARLERAAEDNKRKEDAAAAMRDDLSRLVREFDAQSADMKRTIIRQEKEVQEGARAAAAAEERAARLAQQLGDAQRALAAERDALRRLQDERQEAANTIDRLNKEAMTHVEEIERLKTMINDKEQHQNEIEADISSLKQYVCKLEAEKFEVREQLDKAAQDCIAKASTIDELTREAQELQRSLTQLQAAFTSQREADAKTIDELTAAAGAKQRELDANTGAIAGLMADLKGEADARARADSALAAARRQADAERAAAAAERAAADSERAAAAARARQLDDAVQRLDAAARAKDAELSAQMAIILDMRGEKERLQERIQGMQNTIDNIQKELTGRLLAPAADAGEPPELDAPLYNFLSDGSVDGDALDPREVGRRFSQLARGGARGGLAALRQLQRAQGSMSLSQVKDDLKTKSRTFFKNKRSDDKLKKFKQTGH